MRTKAQIHCLSGHTNTVSEVRCQAAEPQVTDIITTAVCMSYQHSFSRAEVLLYCLKFGITIWCLFTLNCIIFWSINAHAVSFSCPFSSLCFYKDVQRLLQYCYCYLKVVLILTHIYNFRVMQAFLKLDTQYDGCWWMIAVNSVIGCQPLLITQIKTSQDKKWLRVKQNIFQNSLELLTLW